MVRAYFIGRKAVKYTESGAVFVSEKIQRPWKLWLKQLSAVWTPIALIAILLTFAGFLPEDIWLCDVACIFRMQYIPPLFAAVLIFLASRKKALALVSLMALLLNLLAVLPLYLPQQQTGIATGASKLRIFQMNVNNLNTWFEPGLQQIKQLAPDIVSVEEVTPDWQNVLEQNLPEYPYRKVQARDDSFGIAVFSKIPLENAEVIYPGNAEVPVISATVKHKDKPFRLLAVHVLPPRLLDYFLYRNEEYKKIVELLSAETKPVVLVGDLNSPPWSKHFINLCRDGKFKDSEQGFGIQPSWPTMTPLLLLPIDHLLIRGNIRVLNRFVTGPIGSDHYPVCTDILL